jgi:excisionase family DNA binding protein
MSTDQRTANHILDAVADLQEAARQLIALLREAGAGDGGATAEPTIDLTVKQVAALLGRSPSTVREWCAKGVLPGYRLRGAQWRVSRADLRAFQQAERERHVERVAQENDVPPSSRTERLARRL